MRDQWLDLTVSDTGPGIGADRLETIFESFSQGDGSVARQQGGTGLGLAISRQLAELHGGSISVTSEVGVGSHFTLSLPLSLTTREMLTPDSRPNDPVSRLLAGH